METVNGTRTDPAAPAGSAANNAVITEGNVTPAEREEIRQPEAQSPAQVVGRFANLIVQRRFDEALGMWAPDAAGFNAEQMAARFERFDTIQAEVGQMSGGQGGGQQVQLTLTGTREDGTPYSLTGPVTVVQGDRTSGRNWQVARVVLTSNPRAADALVDQ